MEKGALNVKTRQEKGTSAAKRLRIQGDAPAVVYAKEDTPLPITINQREFIKFLHKHGENAIISLNIDGKGKEDTVIIKEIQYEVIRSGIIHVDFQRIKLTEKNC